MLRIQLHTNAKKGFGPMEDCSVCGACYATE